MYAAWIYFPGDDEASVTCNLSLGDCWMLRGWAQKHGWPWAILRMTGGLVRGQLDAAAV